MNDRSAFEREILSIAKALKIQNSAQYADATPKSLCSELRKIDKEITRLLQTITPLNLDHEEGQDLLLNPYNWPLAMELSSALAMIQWQRGLREANILAESNYPTQLIRELQNFRDAARHAANENCPGRGNSERRSSESWNAIVLSKNFVFRYRLRFGGLPPISKTGWIVDLMDKALQAAGIDGWDAAEVLRRAIDRDSGSPQPP